MAKIDTSIRPVIAISYEVWTPVESSGNSWERHRTFHSEEYIKQGTDSVQKAMDDAIAFANVFPRARVIQTIKQPIFIKEE